MGVQLFQSDNPTNILPFEPNGRICVPFERSFSLARRHFGLQDKPTGLKLIGPRNMGVCLAESRKVVFWGVNFWMLASREKVRHFATSERDLYGLRLAVGSREVGGLVPVDCFHLQ